MNGDGSVSVRQEKTTAAYRACRLNRDNHCADDVQVTLREMPIGRVMKSSRFRTTRHIGVTGTVG